MTFDEILDQALALLQRRGRLTYRALQRQFNLDEAYLADLRDEIIQGQRLAVDEGGAVLVWTGGSAPVPAPASTPERVPLAYTPPHLVEKIRTARTTLEGERKQVTVLFADIKDSTELIRGLDPEAAQQLLGEIATHSDPPEVESATTHYHQALSLAEELSMRPLQAHCHRGLGSLYEKTGHPEPTRVELSTAMALYRAMDMTFWLHGTTAMLAQVEG